MRFILHSHRGVVVATFKPHEEVGALRALASVNSPAALERRPSWTLQAECDYCCSHCGYQDTLMLTYPLQRPNLWLKRPCIDCGSSGTLRRALLPWELRGMRPPTQVDEHLYEARAAHLGTEVEV